MNQELSDFAARVRGFISPVARPKWVLELPPFAWKVVSRQFDALALELFSLQFKYNPAYRKICEARAVTPDTVCHWTQVPFVPTGAFKELELTSLVLNERTVVFHSSGTTEQKPSRHFHNAESLELYETSLWKHFTTFFATHCQIIFLTPRADVVPHSSLVHMFETIRQKLGLPESAFVGTIAGDGSWAVDFSIAVEKIKQACDANTPLSLLGTAFSFVHLLDCLEENKLRFILPAGSCVMETGGYKNRSRILPKSELHKLMTDRLGVSGERIICEYGMSELSSQAYEGTIMLAGTPLKEVRADFFFPHWVKFQIISPETWREVADGEVGLIRIFDLGNVFSVAAIQTEDLGIRRGDCLELIGRVQLAEPRGCSLMSA